MERTSVLYTAITQSQQQGVVTNDTQVIGNPTRTGHDGIEWETWMLQMTTNPAYQVGRSIMKYVLVILCAIGVPCNFLSFLVLRRITPVTSAILIMMILAVQDSLSLLMDVASRLSIITFMNIGCSIFLIASYVLQYMTIWLVVLLTLERVVAVRLPMKAAQVCTLAIACRSMAILFSLVVLICIPHIFIYEERSTGFTSGCYTKLQCETFYAQWMVVDCVLFIIIPLMLLCLSNITIIVKLRTTAVISKATHGCSGSEENKRQNRSVTVMLLAVSITTIRCIGPNLTYTLIGSNWLIMFNVVPITYARRYLAIWISMVLSSANNAVNFFLYVISGRRFRTELYKMISPYLGQQMRTSHLSSPI